MPTGEAEHHLALAPAVVQGANGNAIAVGFDAEGEVPYYFGRWATGIEARPSYSLFSPTGYGDRSTFYGWLDVADGELPSPNCQRRARRAIRSAPMASQFESAEAFHDAQAQWYREYGDGSELTGTRRQRNQLFDRLRDRVHRFRRARANPSGTQRNA
jgi:hypothetical protein